MMAQILVYGLAVAAVLAVVGSAIEHLAAGRGVPRRLVWIVVMGASIAWPVTAVLLAPATPMPAPAAIIEPSGLQATSRQRAGLDDPGPLPLPETESSPLRATGPAPSAFTSGLTAAAAPSVTTTPSARRWPFANVPDGHVLRGWVALTALAWLHLLVASLLLRRHVARWRRTCVDGEDLLVSPAAGPALIGVIKPRIVVPRWFLDEPATNQSMILAHERQHRAARDPLLLRVALLAVTLLPWNLPLWWQLRRLRLAIELDCDARVLAAGSAPATYGEVLLRVARLNTATPALALSMSLPASVLERRIRQLVREAPAPRARLRLIGALLVAFAGTALALALDAPPPASRTIPASIPDPVPVAAMPSAAGAGGPAGTGEPVPLVGAAVPVSAASPAPSPVPPPAMAAVPASDPPPPDTTAVLEGATATDRALSALLRAHPELLSHPAGEGWYSAAVVQRADGGVFRSALRFADDRTQAFRNLLDLRYVPAVAVAGAGSPPPRVTIALRRAGERAPDGRALPHNLIFLHASLPAGYDEQHSVLHVWESVFARHGELLLPRDSTFANRVTVLMSADGRISRESVEVGTREDMLRAPPDFTQLGIREEELGVRGTTTLTRNDYEVDDAPLDQQMLKAALWSALGVRDELVVHYAWLRGSGAR